VREFRMQISIDLHLVNNYQKSLRSGTFEVRSEEDIPKVAHNWVRQVRRDTSHHSNIDKVIVDGNKDITDKVKAIDEDPLKW
jgi:hypothetical protein